jgi:hypothetical protein
MKKLLDVAGTLCYGTGAEKSHASEMNAGLADFIHRKPVSASEQVNDDIYQEL